MDTMGFDEDGMPNTTIANCATTGCGSSSTPDIVEPQDRQHDRGGLRSPRPPPRHQRRGGRAPVHSRPRDARHRRGSRPVVGDLRQPATPRPRSSPARGSWTGPCTPQRPTIGRPADSRHANFYRVVSVTGNTVELQSPIKTPADNSEHRLHRHLRRLAGCVRRVRPVAPDAGQQLNEAAQRGRERRGFPCSA